MFLSLWHYFRGYVIVEVSGYNIDKFIRLAISNRVVLWQVARHGDKVCFCTSIQGFKRLKPYAKKAKCRMRITGRHGLPFLTFKYRKRWLFAVGSLVFCLGLLLLTSFVWLVDVEGNERVDTTAIIQCLDEAGYSPGKLKGTLELREAEKLLMNTYPEIVWIGMKFEGTKLLVQVSEAVPKPEIHQAGAPNDLVAKRDTLITYIVADKGMPAVKVGDTVKAGDVLITGKIPLEILEGSTYFTESIGKVRGKTGYSLKATMPLVETKKHYTQEVATSYRLKLFDTTIPLWQSKKAYTHFDELITINQLRLTDMLPLPFYFEKYQKVAYTPEMIPVDEQKAKDQLVGALFDQLYEEIGKDAKILKQEVIYTKTEEAWVAELNVIAEENVALYKALPIDELIPTQPMDTEGAH